MIWSNNLIFYYKLKIKLKKMKSLKKIIKINKITQVK